LDVLNQIVAQAIVENLHQRKTRSGFGGGEDEVHSAYFGFPAGQPFFLFSCEELFFFFFDGELPK